MNIGPFWIDCLATSGHCSGASDAGSCRRLAPPEGEPDGEDPALPGARLAVQHGFSLHATRTEIRAFYGGLEIGLGLFLLIGACLRRWIAAALVAVILAFGCTAAGRALGLVLDAPQAPAVLAFLLVEVALAILGAAALARFVTQYPPATDGMPGAS